MLSLSYHLTEHEDLPHGVPAPFLEECGADVHRRVLSYSVAQRRGAVIAEVTQALSDHLLTETADVGADWIEVASLESGATLTADRLQVCLYAIEESPVVHPPGAGASLDLRLHYVLHDNSTDHLEAQARLDRVRQVIHATPVLIPDSMPAATIEIRLQSLTADERNGLWVAFGRGLRLAVYCRLDVAFRPGG